MITIKTEKDIEYLRVAGKRLSSVLSSLEDFVEVGMTTDMLDTLARKLVAEYGDESAFLGYTPEGADRPYPSALCVSINDEIVHGISSENPRTIMDGDMVSLDMGLVHNGLIVDSARTIIAGGVTKEKRMLLKATREALHVGIREARGGAFTGDIGFAIAAIAKEHNFGIAQGLAGHGVGYSVHEDPYVPNKGKKGTGERLVPGMVIAIEPMFCLGKGAIMLDTDGYTYKTADGSLSAHFEHTILITEGAPEVLTK